MYKSKLSSDPTALILGIISLFILLFVCCCGLLLPVSLALAIVGWVMAHKSIKEYETNPEVFNSNSRSNVGIARILCIVSTILNGLLILVFAVGMLFFQSDIFEKFRKEFEKQNGKNIVISVDTTANDTVEDDALYQEKSQDSIAGDSVEVKL
ncbi:CCC motif membrane protein [Flavobacterium sp. N1719]|uniref:CCC motif membrane protein n=1 Tax=Flavobacterium sp. N1719 TaxID=2885633 RepID=UPI0022234725|nr:CCC motif membrane protein [Flavobacterium sp. N1719]